MLEHKGKKTQIIIIAFLIVLGVAYYFPVFLSEGVNYCDDTTFHLGRLISLGNVWTNPVNFNSFGNNGSMVNIFYPWLTMYPMRLLYKATNSYVLAYKLFYTLLTIATLIIGYYSIKCISKSNISGLLFAVLYTFSSYRYVDIFKRDALGEAIAISFLPIVLLGIYKVFFDDHRDYKYLVIGMTLIAYTHLLSVFIATLFIFGLLILSFLSWNKKKERLISLAKAALLSIGLSLAVFIPMLEQFHKNNLFVPEGNGKMLQKSAYSLISVINSSLKNNASWKGIGTLGILSAIIALLAIIILLLRKPIKDTYYLIYFELYGLLLFAATTDLIPWKWIGDNTPLASIQFVWRINAYPTLLFTTAFAISIPLLMKKRRALLLILVITCISCGLHYNNLIHHNGMPSKDPIKEKEVGTWSSKNVDYAPVEAEAYREKNGRTMEYIIIDGERIEEKPNISDNGSVYSITIGESKKEMTVDVPVYKFESQILKVNGISKPAALSERGTTLIQVDPSDSTTISIEYKYSFIARIAWVISSVIAVTTMLISIIGMKARQT